MKSMINMSFEEPTDWLDSWGANEHVDESLYSNCAEQHQHRRALGLHEGDV